MKRMKVEGYNNLVRDGRTGAILNTNRIEIERAKKQKQAEQHKRERIEILTEEVKTLKDDMSQIKNLLFRLVEGKDD